MNTGTVGLAVVARKSKSNKNTKVLKAVSMLTCCQNQY
mgnify:CR=1 FL=1